MAKQSGCARSLLIVISIGIFATGTCCSTPYLSPIVARRPEINIEQLVQNQLAAFPSGVQTGEITINTDSDFTYARWAVTVRFYLPPQTWLQNEEVHVFQNPMLAHLIRSPSPGSVAAWGAESLPEDWDYKPAHADRFHLRYVPEELGKGTYYVLVRYQEYTFFLQGQTSELFTLADLQRVLEVTDAEMAAFLKASALRPGSRRIPSGLLDKIGPGQRP